MLLDYATSYIYPVIKEKSNKLLEEKNIWLRICYPDLNYHYTDKCRNGLINFLTKYWNLLYVVVHANSEWFCLLSRYQTDTSSNYCKSGSLWSMNSNFNQFKLSWQICFGKVFVKADVEWNQGSLKGEQEVLKSDCFFIHYVPRTQPNY